jgi:plasmid stability protein
MPRVIQIRDVPDEVHSALTAAAAARGMSLSRFARGELEAAARRAQVARENADVVRRTKAAVGRRVDREAILAAIHAGRDE